MQADASARASGPSGPLPSMQIFVQFIVRCTSFVILAVLLLSSRSSLGGQSTTLGHS